MHFFLIGFTLISGIIKFGLSGAEFSPLAEKLEPWADSISYVIATIYTSQPAMAVQ